MEETKKGKGLVVFVVILILIILGLIGYILYDKGIILKEKEEPKVEKKEKKVENKDSEIENIDYEKVDKQLNKYFGRFALGAPKALINDEYGKSGRLNLVYDIIMADNEYKTDSVGENCNNTTYTIYVSKDFYLDKYKEVYGDNYSFAEDYDDDNSRTVLCEKDDRYYSYGGDGTFPYSSTGFKSKELTKKENKYILSGDYVREYSTDAYDEKGNKIEAGTKIVMPFEVVYTKNNGKRYLVNITIKEEV